ncbi:MAG: hypothetical protein JXA23_08235, partial [Bacteroidales bacterium]|nr:hypothetical protein [Bacteroidales bacterium]
MIDKKIIEQIHEDLEGKLTPEGHNLLQEKLASDPEAKKYYTDWQQLGKSFEKSRNTVPELQLAQDIVRQIHAQSS